MGLGSQQRPLSGKVRFAHARAQGMYWVGTETHSLEGPLALVLALRQIVLAIIPVAVRSEVGVVLGAPLAVVDAVDDAAQLPAVLPQAPVQAPAALLRLALPGIPARMAQALRMRAAHLCEGQLLACPANQAAWDPEQQTGLEMPSAHRSRTSLQKKRCGLKAFPLQAPRHTSRRLRLATRVIMCSIAMGLHCHGSCTAEYAQAAWANDAYIIDMCSFGCGRERRRTRGRQPQCASRRPGRP